MRIGILAGIRVGKARVALGPKAPRAQEAIR